MQISKSLGDSQLIASGIKLLLAYLNDLPIDRFHPNMEYTVLKNEFLSN